MLTREQKNRIRRDDHQRMNRWRLFRQSVKEEK